MLAVVGIPPRNQTPPPGVLPQQTKETAMKGVIAYFLGIPIVIIILLYMTDVF